MIRPSMVSMIRFLKAIPDMLARLLLPSRSDKVGNGSSILKRLHSLLLLSQFLAVGESLSRTLRKMGQPSVRIFKQGLLSMEPGEGFTVSSEPIANRSRTDPSDFDVIGAHSPSYSFLLITTTI